MQRGNMGSGQEVGVTYSTVTITKQQEPSLFSAHFSFYCVK